VQVTSSAGSAAGLTVQFRVASGSVSLSSTNALTDSNGQAQVTATAGAVTGPATVVATISGNTGVGSQTFNLTVAPPAPTITTGNFVNAADYQSNSFSPCSLAALVASAGSLGVSNLSPAFPGLGIASSALGLSVGSMAAPVLSVNNNAKGQQVVTFQVPCNVAAGDSVPVNVTVGGGTSSVNLKVQAASPGVFQTTMSDGQLRAVLIRPDGSFVSLENPARRGENEVALVTGLGATTPATNTLSVAIPGTTGTVQGNIIVGMNGGGVPFNSAQLSPDLPGVYLVSFQIPSDMATGNDVTFSVGVIPAGGSSTIYSATSKIPVQ